MISNGITNLAVGTVKNVEITAGSFKDDFFNNSVNRCVNRNGAYFLDI